MGKRIFTHGSDLPSSWGAWFLPGVVGGTNGVMLTGTLCILGSLTSLLTQGLGLPAFFQAPLELQSAHQWLCSWPFSAEWLLCQDFLLLRRPPHEPASPPGSCSLSGAMFTVLKASPVARRDGGLLLLATGRYRVL